jgi:hypothetical protein
VAFNAKSGLINNKPVGLENSQLARRVVDMGHGEVKYVGRDQYGVGLRDRRKIKLIKLNGFAPVYTEDEVEKLADMGTLPDLARALRIIRPRRRDPIEGYIIDDSAFNQGEDTHADSRVPYVVWESNLRPMPVIWYIGNVLDAEIMKETMARQFKLDIGENVLHQYSSLAP